MEAAIGGVVNEAVALRMASIKPLASNAHLDYFECNLIQQQITVLSELCAKPFQRKRITLRKLLVKVVLRAIILMQLVTIPTAPMATPRKRRRINTRKN